MSLWGLKSVTVVQIRRSVREVEHQMQRDAEFDDAQIAGECGPCGRTPHCTGPSRISSASRFNSTGDTNRASRAGTECWRGFRSTSVVSFQHEVRQRFQTPARSPNSRSARQALFDQSPRPQFALFHSPAARGKSPLPRAASSRAALPSFSASPRTSSRSSVIWNASPKHSPYRRAPPIGFVRFRDEAPHHQRTRQQAPVLRR